MKAVTGQIETDSGEIIDFTIRPNRYGDRTWWQWTLDLDHPLAARREAADSINKMTLALNPGL